jgi:hypothetical protein
MKNAVTRALVPSPGGRGRLRGITAAFLLGHRPDDQRSVLDLLAHQLELGQSTLFGALSGGFHALAPIPRSNLSKEIRLAETQMHGKQNLTDGIPTAYQR